MEKKIVWKIVEGVAVGKAKVEILEEDIKLILQDNPPPESVGILIGLDGSVLIILSPDIGKVSFIKMADSSHFSFYSCFLPRKGLRRAS